jgi:hypothetical protein
MDNRILCLALSGRANDADWASLSAQDWEALSKRAQAEGVGPLLYRALSRPGKGWSVPAPARDFLRLIYAATRIQNQAIFAELEGLLPLFQRAGIPVVLLKGACFAQTVYPDIGLRPMGDVDLLVPGPKLAEAARIAKSRGFVDTVPEAAPGLRDLLNHEICLRKPGPQPVTLELHHSLVADKTFSYAVPVEWFWSQTEPLGASAQAGFGHVLALTPTAQVLYAAAHAMLQHGGQNTPLRWIYDLDRLLRVHAGRVDWELMLSQARKFEWGSALEAALIHTVACFATPIPDGVLAALAESPDRHRGLVALKQTRPATHLLLERQKLMSLNGYGRFRLVLALAFPSPVYMLWRYGLKNGWLLPIRYTFRWLSIAADALRTLGVLMRERLKSM